MINALVLCFLVFIAVYFALKLQPYITIQSISWNSLSGIQVTISQSRIRIKSITFSLFLTIFIDSVHVEHLTKSESFPPQQSQSQLSNLISSVMAYQIVRIFLSLFKCIINRITLEITGKKLKYKLQISKIAITTSSSKCMSQTLGVQTLFGESTNRYFQISADVNDVTFTETSKSSILQTEHLNLDLIFCDSEIETSKCVMGILCRSSKMKVNIPTFVGETEIAEDDDGLFDTIKTWFDQKLEQTQLNIANLPRLAVLISSTVLNSAFNVQRQIEISNLNLLAIPVNPAITDDAYIHSSAHFKCDKIVLMNSGELEGSLEGILFWNEARLVKGNHDFPVSLPFMLELDSFLQIESIAVKYSFEAHGRRRESLNEPESIVAPFSRDEFKLLNSLAQVKLRVQANTIVVTASGLAMDFGHISVEVATGMADGVGAKGDDIWLVSVCEIEEVQIGWKEKGGKVLSGDGIRGTVTLRDDFAINVNLVFKNTTVDLKSLINKREAIEKIFLLLHSASNDSNKESILNLILKITVSISIEDGLLSIVSATEPHHKYHLRIRNASLKTEIGVSKFLEIEDLMVQCAPHNCELKNLVHVQKMQINQRPFDDVLYIQTSDTYLHVDISKIYIFLQCVSPLAWIKDIANKKNTLSDSLSTRIELKLQVKIPLVHAYLVLPEDVKLYSMLTAVEISKKEAVKVSIKSFVTSVLKEPLKRYVELAILNNMIVNIKPVDIRVASEFSRLIIPNDWPFSNLIENSTNLVRAVKQIIRQSFNRDFINPFLSGATYFREFTVPKVTLKSDQTEIIIVDNHFESVLARNYQLGYDENQSRLIREKEFMKKAKTRGSMDQIKLQRYLLTEQLPSKTADREIARAWQLLQGFNSDAYIKMMSKHGDEGLPPLLTITITDFEVEASAPILPLSVEKILHDIDENTPEDLIYDDLIARNVTMTLRGIEMLLRDYSNPLLSLPPSSGTLCTMQGLIVIADPASPAGCSREVKLPMDFDNSFISISRTLNPTKVYMRTTTIVKTESAMKATWGAPYEPCLADVITVIDNFTKPSEDPSAPVGWWDKLRILLHGTNTFKVVGGKLSFLILGSNSPYFDPRRHFGTGGLEMTMKDDVEIIFGGGKNDADFAMEMECGELKMNIPRSSLMKAKEQDEICFAKFTGGVRLVLRCNCVTPSPSEPLENIKPWRRHHDLVMQSALSRRESLRPNTLKNDSFYGFRSQFMILGMEIQSPRPCYEGTTQNCLFLNAETLDGIEKLSNTYQSLLTNVPIKRGNLFNNIKVQPKPKLGRVVTSIHLEAYLKPLILSFILACEDGEELVGCRLRSEELNLSAHFRQYDVKLVAQSLLERKAVTKWIRECSTLSFVDVEARALSYCEEDSDLYIPPMEDNEVVDWTGWLFKEDYCFKDTSKLNMMACIWTPKIDFLTMEDSKQTKETERSAIRAIYTVQHSLYQRRLDEVEELITKCEENKRMAAGRGAVFFDDIPTPDYGEELELLNEKREVLLNAIQATLTTHGGAYAEDEFTRSKVFDSKYIVHNLKMLWNVTIRNILFRVVELETKNRFLSYCISNAAAQVASELVTVTEKLHNQKTRKVGRNFTAPALQSDVQELLDGLLSDLLAGVDNVVSCETALDPNKSALPAGMAVKEMKLENDVLVRFINPQIHFEVVSGDGGSSAVVISALRMQVQFLLVMDSKYTAEKDRQDSIMKFRNIWSMEESQFLVQNNDAREAKWITLECLIDHNVPVPLFCRIIDHARIVLQNDKPNPLYTQRVKLEIVEEPNTFYFHVPVLRCTSTSFQYVSVFDLFKNLLVYRDPASGLRAEKLKKMLLTLEQSDDIQYYRHVVLALQEKVRRTEFLIKYGKRGELPLSAAEHVDIRTSRSNYREDLLVLMEGLKNMQNIESKRQSLNISMQLSVKIDEFYWLLQQDDETCLCRWTIKALDYLWINNEDQSNSNTLEIDSTHIENLSESPNMFREVIAAYIPDGKVINFERHKMIRVYWRETAPVAGIQVVAHFEVNICPLLIQLTFDFGKHLAQYLFPALKGIENSKQLATLGSDSKIKLERKSEVVQSPLSRKETTNQIQQMQARANENKSFIYIKVPGVQHCLSYRGTKEKNFEDLDMFAFYLPTLEYRNKTWTWLDFLHAIKRGNSYSNLDALRAALANTGALVREKFFSLKSIKDGSRSTNMDENSSENGELELDRISTISRELSIKKGATLLFKKAFKKQ